jgi:putative NADH-flavin reductase
MDQESFPTDFAPFNDGRAVEFEVLKAAKTDVDRVVVVAPPTPLDNITARTGKYLTTGSRLDPYEGPSGPTTDYPYDDFAPRFTFTDLAVALVDEADSPRHHRELVGVRH